LQGTFVTGTDTEVGKTVVSSVLVASLRRSGAVGYWKPVQTGMESDDATAEVLSNPKDGVWLFVRYLTSPEDPNQVGEEDMVFAQDVLELVSG